MGRQTCFKENFAAPPQQISMNTTQMTHENIKITAGAPTKKEPLLIKVWQSGQIPKDWKHGLIIKLSKKGDLTECSNWRGITLLSIIGKILATIICNIIKKELEPKMRPEQAGFRSHRACVDHITTLRIIVEQSVKFCSPLETSFYRF